MNSILWFKRDLRLSDHAALIAAAHKGDPILPIYIFDQEWWCGEDASRRQLCFVLESLADLDRALRTIGSRLYLLMGEPLTCLQSLYQALPFSSLYSHQETGNAISFARDVRIKAWCKKQQINWHEPSQFAVQRGPLNRDNWTMVWQQQMQQQLHLPPQQLMLPKSAPAPLSWSACLEALQAWAVNGDDIAIRQCGGRTQALQVWQQFLHVRSSNYRQSLSSPMKAQLGNSRLSPYITWGCLSMREIFHGLSLRITELDDLHWLAELNAFKSRLYWHCHFIQKLESEPAIEFHNMNRGFDDMRNETGFTDEEQRKLSAWCDGKTGYPLIDACMQMLIQTGWINFRMRAMLISFATHHLWLHWRQPGLHLARLFVDYEPGIHFSQLQMQAGVTGINALRVYNPVKQQRDQDPDGVFVRRWLPALQQVPTAYLCEPWRMPHSVQERVGCVIGRDYPAPIVAHEDAAKLAKTKLHAWRQQPHTRHLATQVMQQHGSRKKPSRRVKTTKSTVINRDQLSLDFP